MFPDPRHRKSNPELGVSFTGCGVQMPCKPYSGQPCCLVQDDTEPGYALGLDFDGYISRNLDRFIRIGGSEQIICAGGT